MQNVDLGSTKSGLKPNMAGMIAYLPFWIGLIASIYFVLTEKENHFVRFHAWQSLLLSAATLVVWLPLYLIGIWPLALLVSLVGLAAWLWCLYQAYKGEEYRLPLIGELAAQHA